MRRDRQLYTKLALGDSTLLNPTDKVLLIKGKPIKIAKFEELEYVYNAEGRCMSYRSRGKITSVLVRNSKYGVEQRIFIYNPRLVLEY